MPVQRNRSRHAGTDPRRSADQSISAGSPYPLGATWNCRGTNFAVFSSIASRVELCLFDGAYERRIALPERTHLTWHGYVPGVGPGQQYGFRVHGPWQPDQGHRCNPAKLLLDPYARAIAGEVRWDPAMLPYTPGSDGETPDTLDRAPFMPRAVVTDPSFDWQGEKPIDRPMADSVIYEMHVKGFSMGNPDVPNEIRGTYAGLAHPASVAYLTGLGITAVELLPVHAFVHESYLVERGLSNYWGYNSIGFFAPHGAYATAADDRAVQEFKTMVRALHAAGIEVILDVVYNHTAEGNHLGPMLSFKGLDNMAYYRTMGENPRFYMDYAGTGNTIHAQQAQALQMILDSLRYWVTEMHVDGFRFDLASALGRGSTDFDRYSAFFAAVHQDPALQRTKLIAEPWDVHEGGYQVGNFPRRWSEWNGRFRDTVRDYWRSQPGTRNDFATRITGSADLYDREGRSPAASVNLVTVHDGFTLKDLVSFNEKHNEANGEGNNDGTNDNRSWNLGAEGDTDDPIVLSRRFRQTRNFLATTLLAHRVPLILSGDEVGHTQGGNNNAYCQDNAISWLDWQNPDTALLAFARRAIALRLEHRAFRPRHWPSERANRRSLADIVWFAPDGREMETQDWDDTEQRALSLFLSDRDFPNRQNQPRPLEERFILLFTSALETVSFTLPSPRWGREWTVVLDTTEATGAPTNQTSRFQARASLERPELSLLVLQSRR